MNELVAKKTPPNKGGYDSNGSDQLPKNSSSSLAAKDTTINGGEENTDKKRYRGKFAVCDNCEEEYDVSNNHKGDCLWHDGMYLFHLFTYTKVRFTPTIRMSPLPPSSPTHTHTHTHTQPISTYACLIIRVQKPI